MVNLNERKFFKGCGDNNPSPHPVSSYPRTPSACSAHHRRTSSNASNSDVASSQSSSSNIIDLETPYISRITAGLHEFELLQGLIQLVEDAPHDYLEDSDLVKITNFLKTRDDIYFKYQASYALQALQNLPDNETILETVMRYLDGSAQFASIFAKIFKADPKGAVEDAGSFFQFCKDTLETITEAHKTVKHGHEMFREGLNTANSALEQTSETFKGRSWYIGLQFTDVLIRHGQLSAFNRFVSQTGCRYKSKFQWGVCRQLGEIAADSLWETVVRKQAVDFLNELYKNGTELEMNMDVKRWILTILNHISISEPEDTPLKNHIADVLKDLKKDNIKVFPGTYPLCLRLPQPQSFPLLEEVQEKPDLEFDIYKLRSQRMTKYNQPIYIPPMAKPKLDAPDHNSRLLVSIVKEFLDSDRKVLLILGDSGVGKSVFSQHLEYNLWEDYKFGARVPLYIHLPMLKQPDTDLVAEQLKNCGLISHIEKLQKNHQFTLICDGYDECQLNNNLYLKNRLNQGGQSKNKLIISCRSQYLPKVYINQFTPSSNCYNFTEDNLFEECVIVPFTEKQIEEYVDQYVRSEETLWTKKDYMDRLNIIPNLMDLIKNPILLSLCLKTLPTIAQNNIDLKKLQMTRIQLYDRSVMHLLNVDHRRILTTLSEKAENELGTFKEGGFQKHGFEYQMDLAKEMFHKLKGGTIVEFSSNRDKSTWMNRFFGDNPEGNLLQQSSLLRRHGYSRKFQHRSIQEYFYSCNIYVPANDIFKDILPLSNDNPSSQYNIKDDPISQYDIIKESSIIHFLSERISEGRENKNQDFENRLWNIIEESKNRDSKEHAVAAANAITILVKAGVRFNGMDLKGIRIPGADLSNGEFDSTQFQDADLSKVNFTKAWIRHGKIIAVGHEDGKITLHDALDLTQIRTPSSHSGEVLSLAFSPCGEYLLSGSFDKKVQLWKYMTERDSSTLWKHGNDVNTVAFSPNGNLIASGSSDGKVFLRDRKNEQGLRILDHGSEVNGIAYSPDGSRIASAGINRMIRIYCTSGGDLQMTISEGIMSEIKCIAYSRDGRKIISGDMHGHQNKVTDIAFSPNSKQLVSTCWNGTIRRWNLDKDFKDSGYENHHSEITRVVYSLDGMYVVAVDSQGELRQYNAPSGELVTSIPLSTYKEQFIVLSPDGQRFATAGKALRIWNIESRLVEHTLVIDEGEQIATIAFSLCGHMFATGTSLVNLSGETRIWDTMTGKGKDFDNGGFVIPDDRTVGFSPVDGQIVDRHYNSVRIWDLSYDEPQKIESESHVSCFAWSHCGEWIAVGEGKAVSLWRSTLNNPEWSRVTIIRDFHGAIQHIAWHPNKLEFVTGSQDGCLRVWKLERVSGIWSVRLVWNVGHSVFVNSEAIGLN
ncbi:hypothetical protein FBU30_002909 [Linnemannia zychae]|nr:hypothetical protein FBU30_002909 [Linnemannia zychae]